MADINVSIGVIPDKAQVIQAAAQTGKLFEQSVKPIKLSVAGNNNALLGTQKIFSQLTEDANDFGDSLDRGLRRIVALSAASAALFGIVRAFKAALDAGRELEKNLQNINVVLNLPTDKIQEFGKSLFDVARNTKQSFEEVSKAAVEFARQGLGVEETLKRTQAALLLVNLAGVDAVKATEAITSAINSFSEENLKAIDVVNKLVAVDARFAVSSADLAEAITRVGSTAQDAGVGFDKLVSLVTVTQQVAQRGGSTIGNAFKTIFQRIQRPETLDQLEDLGIQVREVDSKTGVLTGTLLSADKVIAQLGERFKTLNQEQKAQVSQLVAGVNQGNIFRSAIAGLAFEQEAYNTALRASDEAVRRNSALLETQDAKIKSIGTSLQEAGANISTLGFGDFLNKTLAGLANGEGGSIGANLAGDIIKGLSGRLEGESGAVGNEFGKIFIKGFSDILLGPGLVALGAIGIKIAQSLGKVTSQVFQQLNPINEKDLVLQEQINKFIGQQAVEINKILASTNSKILQEQKILELYAKQNAELSTQQALRSSIATTLLSKGGLVSGRIKNAAGGLSDAFSREQSAIAQGVGGASPSAKAVFLPNFPTNAGKGVVANTDEYIIPNLAGSGKPAIFNPEMVRQFGLPQGAVKINAAYGFLDNIITEFLKFPTKPGFKPKILPSRGGNQFLAREQIKRQIVSKLPDKQQKVISNFTEEELKKLLETGGFSKGYIPNKASGDLIVLNNGAFQRRNPTTGRYVAVSSELNNILNSIGKAKAASIYKTLSGKGVITEGALISSLISKSFNPALNPGSFRPAQTPTQNTVGSFPTVQAPIPPAPPQLSPNLFRTGQTPTGVTKGGLPQSALSSLPKANFGKLPSQIDVDNKAKELAQQVVQDKSNLALEAQAKRLEGLTINEKKIRELEEKIGKRKTGSNLGDRLNVSLRKNLNLLTTNNPEKFSKLGNAGLIGSFALPFAVEGASSFVQNQFVDPNDKVTQNRVGRGFSSFAQIGSVGALALSAAPAAGAFAPLVAAIGGAVIAFGAVKGALEGFSDSAEDTKQRLSDLSQESQQRLQSVEAGRTSVQRLRVATEDGAAPEQIKQLQAAAFESVRNISDPAVSAALKKQILSLNFSNNKDIDRTSAAFAQREQSSLALSAPNVSVALQAFSKELKSGQGLSTETSNTIGDIFVQSLVKPGEDTEAALKRLKKGAEDAKSGLDNIQKASFVLTDLPKQPTLLNRLLDSNAPKVEALSGTQLLQNVDNRQGIVDTIRNALPESIAQAPETQASFNIIKTGSAVEVQKEIDRFKLTIKTGIQAEEDKIKITQSLVKAETAYKTSLESTIKFQEKIKATTLRNVSTNTDLNIQEGATQIRQNAGINSLRVSGASDSTIQNQQFRNELERVRQSVSNRQIGAGQEFSERFISQFDTKQSRQTVSTGLDLSLEATNQLFDKFSKIQDIKSFNLELDKLRDSLLKSSKVASDNSIKELAISLGKLSIESTKASKEISESARAQASLAIIQKKATDSIRGIQLNKEARDSVLTGEGFDKTVDNLIKGSTSGLLKAVRDNSLPASSKVGAAKELISRNEEAAKVLSDRNELRKLQGLAPVENTDRILKQLNVEAREAQDILRQALGKLVDKVNLEEDTSGGPSTASDVVNRALREENFGRTSVVRNGQIVGGATPATNFNTPFGEETNQFNPFNRTIGRTPVSRFVRDLSTNTFKPEGGIQANTNTFSLDQDTGRLETTFIKDLEKVNNDLIKAEKEILQNFGNRFDDSLSKLDLSPMSSLSVSINSLSELNAALSAFSPTLVAQGDITINIKADETVKKIFEDNSGLAPQILEQLNEKIKSIQYELKTGNKLPPIAPVAIT